MEDSSFELSKLLDQIKQLSAQAVINLCFSSPEFNSTCSKYEKEIWIFLLERDYPLWGVDMLNNPKEYYIRIAEYEGLKLRNVNGIETLNGSLLREEQTRRPFLQMQIANFPPFEISDVIARAYSGTLTRLIDTNLNNEVTDPDLWIFKFPAEDLQVPEFANQVNSYFKSILYDNKLGSSTQEGDLDIINITNFLDCKAMLCDSLIVTVEDRLLRLEKRIIEHNEIFLEEVDFLRIEFSIAPMFVASYLRAISDLFYRTDNFNEEIIIYFKAIKKAIPNISAALMPHGYPFTKYSNLDKFDNTLFQMDPFQKPVVLPDYLGGKVCAILDTSGMDNPDVAHQVRIWKNGKPYPVILDVPDEKTVYQRMEINFEGINNFLRTTAEEMRKAFPKEEAGFIMAGGLPSICFDNWLCDPKTTWLWKTDVDLFVYGTTQQTRKQAFMILFNALTTFLPGREGEPYHYKIWNSVLTISKSVYYDREGKQTSHFPLAVFARDQTVQVINTNSRNGFEVIMNFDTSNIQIGWDCHRGWMATPFWSLYTPRREALIVRYNVRSPRFVKNLYRGYTLKTIMPKSLLLTPKGNNYSYVIDKNKLITLIPYSKATYADDLRLISRARPGHFDPDYVDLDPGPGDVVHAYKQLESYPQENRKKEATIMIDKEIKMLNLGRINAFDADNPEDDTRIWRRITDLQTIPDRIKFNGKFKNGFDAYVREEYLVYSYLGKDLRYIDSETGAWKSLEPIGLSMEEIIKQIEGLKDVRYVMRDCKIILDPRENPIKFDGTMEFKFSLRTNALKERRDRQLKWLKFPHGYSRSYQNAVINVLKKELNEKYEKYPNNVTEAVVEPKTVPIQSETTDLGHFLTLNTSLVRNLYSFPLMMEGIIQIKNDLRTNSGTLPEKIYRIMPVNDKLIPQLTPIMDKKLYGEPEVISRDVFDIYLKYGAPENKKHMYVVIDREKEFDIDNIDLHERLYSDEERELLPVYTFNQWQDIRIGKIKLDNKITAIRIRTPVVIKETLFLDQADWTIDVEDVLRDYRNVMFNCLCYQNFTSINIEGISGGEIMVYRSFMIYE